MSDNKPNLTRKQQGEDLYYRFMRNKRLSYKSIQLGCFVLSKLTESEFNEEITDMMARVNAFVLSNWGKSDDVIFSQIECVSEWSQELVDQTNVMILRYHLQTRTIYIAINHEVVGGGDYLLLGAVMFNGQTNSLIDEPNM